MSYEIIYDKQFVKVEDKFIPMVIIGSNNLYEYSGARVRNWSNLRVSGDSVLFTEEEMLNYCDKVRQDIIDRNEERRGTDWFDEYDDKCFGYWSSIAIGGRSTARTTFGNFKGIFKTGVKKALTLDELAEENITITVKSGYKPKSVEIDSYRKTVTTNEELLTAIAECEGIFEGTGVTVTFEFNGMFKDSLKWIRRRRFPKVRKQKQLIEVDKYYTIKVGYDYFVKRTKNGYRYSSTPYVKYVDKKVAKRRVNQLNKKYSQEYELVEVNEKTKLYITI